MTGVLLLAPMRWEAAALRRGAARATPRRSTPPHDAPPTTDLADAAPAHHNTSADPAHSDTGAASAHGDASAAPIQSEIGAASVQGDVGAAWCGGVGERLPVLRTGTGPVAAARSAARLAGRSVVVVGIGGGLAAGLRTGDVVVAGELRLAGAAPIRLAGAGAVAAALCAAGCSVHIGPVVSTRHLVTGRRRQILAADGALLADTESYWLACGTVPLGCVRVVADGAGDALLRPAMLRRLRAALRVLPTIAAALPAVLADLPSPSDGGDPAQAARPAADGPAAPVPGTGPVGTRTRRHGPFAGADPRGRGRGQESEHDRVRLPREVR